MSEQAGRDRCIKVAVVCAELLAAAKAKLAACDDCKDAALMEGECCSNECAALATAVENAEAQWENQR